MNYKTLFFCALLSGTALLTGCDDKENESTTVQESSVAKQTADEKQQKIVKYNAYVDVANYHPYSYGLAEHVSNHEEYIEGNIKNNKKLTSYNAIDKLNISGKKERLEKAQGIKVSLPDLDSSADKYLKALTALEPVNDELALYGDTKEYLTDNGKFFREKEPQLLALLKETVAAEEKFESKIDEHDTLLIKEQFDSAEKDSYLYYRNGIIFYAKLIVNEIDGLMVKNDSDALKKLEESNSSLSELLKGYIKVKGNNNHSMCESDIKSFVSRSRTMAQEMKQNWDKYTKIRPDMKPEMIKLHMPVSSADGEYKSLMRDFSSLINNMNADRC